MEESHSTAPLADAADVTSPSLEEPSAAAAPPSLEGKRRKKKESLAAKALRKLHLKRSHHDDYDKRPAGEEVPEELYRMVWANEHNRREQRASALSSAYLDNAAPPGDKTAGGGGGGGGGGGDVDGGEEDRNAEQRFPNNYVKTSKYNVLTFLPLFLLDQFKRVANIYFLVISILQLIPGLSPTGTFTTLLVLILVLAINAVKEVYEDYKRHRDDNAINHRLVSVMSGGVENPTHWQDLRVGDIVRMGHNDPIPADILVLASSEPQGMCYIETSSLDGETNLKTRQALTETNDMIGSEEDVSNFRGFCKAEPPNRYIYSFKGTVCPSGQGEQFPCSERQLLLRGSSVRNTKWLYGLVIYTGNDTKLVQNSSRPPFKRTLVERRTNLYIFAVLALLVLLAAGCAVGSTVYLNQDNVNPHWYLRLQNVVVGEQGALNFLSFIILFSLMVPISLYVTMEVVRLFQAFWMSNDLRMYHEASDTAMQPRTTTLNEELGQISMIFSDKTGTLTQNQMQFRKCSIGGVLYGKGYTEIGLANARRRGEHVDESMVPDDSKLADRFVNFEDERVTTLLEGGDNEQMYEFWLALGLCHTIVPELTEEGDIEYQASSPDEMALVRAARAMGFTFQEREPKMVRLRIERDDALQEWELLNVLEFDSTRKRMSVIVRREGRIVLYCKGADTVIEERLSAESQYVDETIAHLQELGEEGLRTLMVAYRDLDAGAYEEWAERFREAALKLDGRKEAVDELAEEIEVQLLLLGATAIEDKLQHGVADTIETLQKAGISVWVLTGDKQETAINIGFACSLLDDDMHRMIVNCEDAAETNQRLEALLEEFGDAGVRNNKLGLVINGHTLRFALEEGMRERFLELALKCKSIICCRVSPLQKAEVVKLAKDTLDVITLAIGDGANDVAMIQAAHVGVGISGEEGLQAVRSSDYAIAQFRFLVPLLLLHGRYSYRRISKLIQWSFYKNIMLTLTQFWYAIFNQFTGQSLYEQWTLGVYNLIFTSLAVVAFAAVDEDVSSKTVLKNPQLYRSGPANALFTLPIFLRWMLNSLYHASVIFWITYALVGEGRTAADGLGTGLWSMGLYSYTAVILVANLRLALETKRWVWFSHSFMWFSIASPLLWYILYAPVYPALRLGPEMYFVPYRVFQQASFWLGVPLMVVVALGPNFFWTYVSRTYRYKDYHIVQEMEKENKHVDMPQAVTHSADLPEDGADRRAARRHTGYAFSPGVTSQELEYNAREPRSRELAKSEQQFSVEEPVSGSINSNV